MKTRNHIRGILPLLLLLLMSACSGEEPKSVADIDGKSYKTVAIGGMIWTAENLNVARYRNGDPIPEVRDPEKWSTLTTGAWCWYENSDNNGKTYGRLYNWYAINDPRGLAPEGWRIATDKDWTTLTESLGGEEIAGGRIKAARLWQQQDSETGKSGFELLPSGARRDTDGAFVLQGEYSRLWSSTEIDSIRAWGRAVGHFDPVLRRGHAHKRLGFAVRCVKE